ncbi:Uncharacterised protein [Mycobacteroides abscessus subsp. abscessus]|nr:Uncharacterised protein [Mycobacteroides abscessus subsp. abscessus]
MASGYPPSRCAMASNACPWSSLRCLIARAASGDTGSGVAEWYSAPLAESIRP